MARNEQNSKKEKNQTTKLTGDAETLCAIVARIIARIVEENHLQKIKA